MVFLSILILITNYINYKLPVVYHVSLVVHRCFFVFDGSLHECHEQRMRVQYRTAIFRMELCTDKPFQSLDFNDFYQIRFRVDTYTFHAGSFILVFIIIVELIAMTVTFLNVFLTISLICFLTFLQYTFVSAQTHRTTQIGDCFLLFHDINHVVRSLLVHFA